MTKIDGSHWSKHPRRRISIWRAIWIRFTKGVCEWSVYTRAFLFLRSSLERISAITSAIQKPFLNIEYDASIQMFDNFIELIYFYE